MFPVILVSYGFANEITSYELEKAVSVLSRKGGDLFQNHVCKSAWRRPGYLIMVLKFPRFGLA
jgi:hypothetical protein